MWSILFRCSLEKVLKIVWSRVATSFCAPCFPFLLCSVFPSHTGAGRGLLWDTCAADLHLVINSTSVYKTSAHLPCRCQIVRSPVWFLSWLLGLLLSCLMIPVSPVLPFASDSAAHLPFVWLYQLLPHPPWTFWIPTACRHHPSSSLKQ